MDDPARNVDLLQYHHPLPPPLPIMNPQALDWQPGGFDPIVPESESTLLFDRVRAQFCDGIATLENLLRYMESGSTAACKQYAKGINNLLSNMVALARWLVGFLDRATACQKDSLWTRSAITGLRVELHTYSWKVMRISMMLTRT